MSVRGLRVVVTLEARQRLRGRAAWVVLGVWVAVLVGLTAWLSAVMNSEPGGAYLFDSVVLLVLALGLIVAPAFSATSINADRQSGVLVALQATRLTAAEIVVGKLLAAWASAGALIVVALPVLFYALILDGVAMNRLVAAVAIISVLVGLMCALSLGWSASFRSTAVSSAVSALTVFGLSTLTVLFFALSVPAVTTTEKAAVWQPRSDMVITQNFPLTVPEDTPTPKGCQKVIERDVSVTHYTWNWWVLALNPFVIAADAIPYPDVAGSGPDASFDSTLLPLMKDMVREIRSPHGGITNNCTMIVPDRGAPAVWPWGLVFLAFGAGANLHAATRNLALPMSQVNRGARVA